MTVKELKEKLEKCNDEALVVMEAVDWEGSLISQLVHEVKETDKIIKLK